MSAIDLDHLLRLRVVVGRFGELDRAQWWNTRGQLGPFGATAIRRGFPRTHYFAQARSVFGVAANRCMEVFHAPGVSTLWNLGETVEEEFEARWELWLDAAPTWFPFFERVSQAQDSDLRRVLAGFELASEPILQASKRLRRSAEGRTVPLPGPFQLNDETVTMLAAGFACGAPAALSVPYIARQD